MEEETEVVVSYLVQQESKMRWQLCVGLRLCACNSIKNIPCRSFSFSESVDILRKDISGGQGRRRGGRAGRSEDLTFCSFSRPRGFRTLLAPIVAFETTSFLAWGGF